MALARRKAKRKPSISPVKSQFSSALRPTQQRLKDPDPISHRIGRQACRLFSASGHHRSGGFYWRVPEISVGTLAPAVCRTLTDRQQETECRMHRLSVLLSSFGLSCGSSIEGVSTVERRKADHERSEQPVG